MSEASRFPLHPLAPWPDVDFVAYGEIDIQPVSRIQQFVAANLSRNWVMIPHVTHHDELDITAVESLRKQLAAENEAKVSSLAFVIRAVVVALKAFPHFNASLSADGKSLVFKKYWNIGLAVDAPGGLLVPVIREADRKGVMHLVDEISQVSNKARTKGLSLGEMSGGGFTISALGGIGGTAFTPIINAPEVAILGLTRTVRRPVEGEDGGIHWRSMLPVSLSYDHRVINGADAARFCVALGKALADPQALLA
jgi:pyruvate dehydrogenase E2 component (dihydrolipoamide acetyltransferase)